MNNTLTTLQQQLQPIATLAKKKKIPVPFTLWKRDFLNSSTSLWVKFGDKHIKVCRARVIALCEQGYGFKQAKFQAAKEAQEEITTPVYSHWSIFNPSCEEVEILKEINQRFPVREGSFIPPEVVEELTYRLPNGIFLEYKDEQS